MTTLAPLAASTQLEPDRNTLEGVVSQVLSLARDAGAHQAEAAVSHDIGLGATARLGDVESIEFTNDRGMGVTVYIDTCKGSASTSDFSEASLREAVGKACTFARSTAADAHAGLADPDRLAGSDLDDLQLYHPWGISMDAAIEMAITSEEAARSHDARITNSEGASVSTNSGARAYGNSHGFLQSVAKTSHSISCTVVGEADGDMQRDYWYSAAREAGALDSAEQVGIAAARRTVERLGARKIKTTTAPVVFAPDVARGFVGHALSALAGSAQYRRSSFLLGAAGKQVFPGFFQFQERPHLPAAMASANYDAEGVATADRDIVRDGVIEGYLLSSYSARRLGLESTANAGGAHNLIVPGNCEGLEEIIAGMSRGLLVNELIGQGVNAVTGDYSRGAAGFWIENGQVAFPVHEVTIAGNLIDLYGRISAVGRDQDLRGGIRCGSVLIDEMKIAGA